MQTMAKIKTTAPSSENKTGGADTATHPEGETSSNEAVAAAAAKLVPKLLEQTTNGWKEHDLKSSESGSGPANSITLSDIIPVPKQRRQVTVAVSEDGEDIHVPVELHKMFGNLFGLISGTEGRQEHEVRKENSQNQSNQIQDTEDITKNHNNDPHILLKWLLNLPNTMSGKKRQEGQTMAIDEKKDTPKSMSYRILEKFVDPSLLEWVRSGVVISSHISDGEHFRDRSELREQANRTATQVIDKILTSTPRILTIVNLLLAVTYLLHSIVADFFLGPANATTGHGHGSNDVDTDTVAFGQDSNATLMGMNGGVGASSSERINRSGRERLGGYLLFKLLLIAAVVKPDTLDLLILLSWYTLLAFLRSLSYLAGITTAHTAASGQSPHRGVLNLLLAVLLCDISAAATCAALFHGAGWGMVILLTCDCGLLALDIFTHLARFTQQVLDERHQHLIANLEARQNQLYENRRNEMDGTDSSSGNDHEEEDHENNDDHVGVNTATDSERDDDEIDRSSRRIDHEIEMLERLNERRLSTLDNTAFGLELVALLSTIAHFLHVWVLHGVTLNLVDGVLALHLHSALSAFGRKIAERRNHNRIVRDLDEYFDYATDMEIMKANAAGDVCCICLCTMSMGSVKKLGCGHLYHTHCLREVVERARSIEAARCPLCRASVLDGKQIPHDESNEGIARGLFFGTGFTNMHQVGSGGGTTERGTNEGLNIPGEAQQNEMNNHARSPDTIPTGGDNIGIQNQNERALFRLSTEGILPAWLPIPAFSFEIVRRFPPGEGEGGASPNNNPRQQNPQAGNVVMNTNNNRLQPQAQQNHDGNSFWRRFLMLTGVAPLSPEEVVAATAQLMDMFPQYNEETIVRELRIRGSTERVAEAILTGQVTGATGADVAAVEHRNEAEQDGDDADISERERIRNEDLAANNVQEENGHDTYVGYDVEEIY